MNLNLINLAIMLIINTIAWLIVLYRSMRSADQCSDRCLSMFYFIAAFISGIMATGVGLAAATNE